MPRKPPEASKHPYLDFRQVFFCRALSGYVFGAGTSFGPFLGSRTTLSLFVGLLPVCSGLLATFSGPRSLFWGRACLSLLWASFQPFLGFWASSAPTCWAPCFNLLKPPCGLLASIYLNLFVAFLVDSPYQIGQAAVEPRSE